MLNTDYVLISLCHICMKRAVLGIFRKIGLGRKMNSIFWNSGKNCIKSELKCFVEKIHWTVLYIDIIDLCKLYLCGWISWTILCKHPCVLVAGAAQISDVVISFECVCSYYVMVQFTTHIRTKYTVYRGAGLNTDSISPVTATVTLINTLNGQNLSLDYTMRCICHACHAMQLPIDLLFFTGIYTGIITNIPLIGEDSLI